MRSIAFTVPLFVTLVTGCGGTGDLADAPRTGMAVEAAHRNLAPSVPMEIAPPNPGMMGMIPGELGGSGKDLEFAAMSAVESPAISRKIIYDCQIDLVVEDVDAVARKVADLVQQAGGYIAEQSMTGSPGTPRSMRWKIRVPTDRFESFVESIVAAGELERNTRTSQDVTEQYYDIQARIKTKRVEEETLLKILQERSGKLEDVLKVEVELSRVRGEIEQLEGRIRLLENLSALATVTLNVRERLKYEPTPPVAADFPTQIARTWEDSVRSLVELGRKVILWAVSWSIWLPILGVAILTAWLLLRWSLRAVWRNLPRWIALARMPILSTRQPTKSD
jgi:hypothetical protein